MRRLLWLAVPGALALGCAQIIGLYDVPPVASDGGGDGGSDDAQPADAGDSGLDAPGCDACAAVVPDGWTPVVLSTTSGACPAGFGDLAQVRIDPAIADAGACTCSAVSQVPPDCNAGTLELTLGCNGSPVAIAIGDGGCTPVNLSVQNSDIAPVIPAGGGSCAPFASPHPGALSSASAIVCSPLGCPDSLCAPDAAPRDFVACIAHDEVAIDGGAPQPLDCPAGPFATRHAAAADWTLDCSKACTTCDASATCGQATVSFYGDGTCNNGTWLGSMTADGTCHVALSGGPLGANGLVYAAAMIGSPSFVASGPMTATATPASPRTICCR